MIRPYWFCAVLLIISYGCREPVSEDTGERLKVVAVFAHPDDETTVAPVLAKYAEEHDVYLITATDGRYGVTDHAQIPAGDSLVEVRTTELQCACSAMKINKPIQLGLLDGLGGDIGINPYHEQLAILEERLEQTFAVIQPDIVITYGPDGDTGHPDHRMVGIMTSEVLLKLPIDSMPALYHFGWTPTQAAIYKGWNLNYVDPSHLNTAVSYEDRHERQLYAAIRCYQSQYTAAQMEEWINFEKENTDNRLFFREYVPAKQERTQL